MLLVNDVYQYFDQRYRILWRANQSVYWINIGTDNALPELISYDTLVGYLSDGHMSSVDDPFQSFILTLILSYEVGSIKPESQIYNLINESTGIPKSSSLFIGDSHLADYEGPTKNGFQARHLIRGHRCERVEINRKNDYLF